MDNSVLKVIDFGFARMVPEAPQALTTPCYTLPYVAPEVISHDTGYTELCDVWSLGIILVRETGLTSIYMYKELKLAGQNCGPKVSFVRRF